ncbi:hypothetical protein ACJMQP_04015 [Rhodopseudomonas palustris]
MQHSEYCHGIAISWWTGNTAATRETADKVQLQSGHVTIELDWPAQSLTLDRMVGLLSASYARGRADMQADLRSLIGAKAL